MFNNKRYIAAFFIIVSMLMTGGSAVFAKENVSAPQLFYKANEFFEKGRYEEAEQAYRQILALGVNSGNIYYNLGNSCFKQGKIGRAIVNYEKAKMLLPQDGDVKANLEYARSLCNNPVIPAKQNWLISIGRNVADHFSLDNWTKILSFVYIFMLLLLGSFVVLRKQLLKKTAISTAVVLLFFTGVWGIKFHDVVMVKKAIVIKSEIDSRFAPSKEAVVHFKAFEGAKIQVIDKNNSWFRIKTPDGKIGWVLQSDIEMI